MDQMPPKALEIMAGRFKLLSSPTRLNILQHLCEGERSVHDLLEATGSKQANLSKQLGILHRAGFLTRRTEGINVYYGMAFDDLMSICDQMKQVVIRSERAIRASLELVMAD